VTEALFFVVGILCAAVAYLIATTQRHERALQDFQAHLFEQKPEGFVTWGGLTGGDDNEELHN